VQSANKEGKAIEYFSLEARSQATLVASKSRAELDHSR